MDAEASFAALKLTLPPAPKAIGLYRPVVISGGYAYLSGHGPLLPDGTLTTGRVGANVGLELAQQAARQTGLAILATLKQELGTLNRVRRLIKLLGMVQCQPDFTQQPAVINGCSQLFRDVFGEEGVGARSAIGVNALPMDMVVEIEAIFEVVPD